MSQLTLYYCPTDMSSQKALLLAAYLGLSIRTEVINTEQFANYSDLLTIPTLKNDNGSIILNEMPAILVYMASLEDEICNGMYPSDGLAQARVNELLEFDYNVLQQHFLATLKYVEHSGDCRPSELTCALLWLNGHLKGRKFIAIKQFSIADLALTVTLSHIRAFGVTITSYTMLNDWHERIKLLLSKWNYVDVVDAYSTGLYEKINCNKIKIECYPLLNLCGI